MPRRHYHRSTEPTPVLFVGSAHEDDELLALLAGALRVEHHDGRRYVGFHSAASAARATDFLALLVPRPEIGYAAPTAAAPDAATVEPAHLSVPPALAAAGCSLLLDFVGAAEASQLLADVDAHPWDSSLARRTQQHGRAFDYTSKNVAAPDGAAIPPCFDGLLARLAAVPRHVLPWDGLADNLTVNEYLPGAGIANHVDTHSAFEDGICALTLGDGCAMRLQRRDESHVIWLPPRALLVLSGASRYEWSHAIAMRRHDVLESGERVARGRRVSLTLRRARGRPCACAFPAFCDSQGGAPIALPTRLAHAAEPARGPPPAPTAVRLVVVSDTHGRHRELPPLPAGDVLIHLGDAAEMGSLDDVRDFAAWLASDATRHFTEVLLVDGNHDRDLGDPRRIDLAREYGALRPRCTLLRDECVRACGGRLCVHGSSWATCEADAFGRTVPRAHDGAPIDVLLTHLPPDLGAEAPEMVHRFGDSQRLGGLVKVRQIPLHLFGHVHAGRGAVHFGSTLYANCASVKNARRETGAPIVARAAVIDFDVASRRASVVELASYTSR